MRLIDVMDKVEVGMKMVVRRVNAPEYELLGGKVTEKTYNYLCLDVQGVPWGIAEGENYEVLRLYDKNGVELFEKGAWGLIEKYVPDVESPEQIYSAALDIWGCYTDEVKRKVSYALAKVMTDDDIEWFFDELSDKHRQIANLLGYEDDCESIDEETDVNAELNPDEETDSYDPDNYEEDGTEEDLYLNDKVCKKLMEIQTILQNAKQKESVNA